MSPSSPPSTSEASTVSAARDPKDAPTIAVKRIHRRDLNRVWDFLKLVFRDVNRETVEYQRPRLKKRFLETYEEEGTEQLLFVAHADGKDEIVGYAECSFEIVGSDNWMNEAYFERKEMRPLYVEELAVHPDYQGRGVGNFMLEQVEHIAKVRGCTHLVLEVAENNDSALKFYRKRSFYKLDAAIFMAKKVIAEEELLPPRKLKTKPAANAPKPSKGEKSGKITSKARTTTPPPKAKGAARKKSRSTSSERASS
jgi:ribosomal protein S18 acetylase RimI-like enzyme